jgi:hypothetical protein
MTIFECVKGYIGGFDPQFPQSVEGASAQEIQELDALTDGTLPAIYRDFLRVMGRSMDWLSINDFDLSVGGVLQFYRTNRWLASTRFVRIGHATQNPLFHPFLEVIPLVDEGPPVVSFPEFDKSSYQDALRFRSPVAGSLEEMICMPVFDAYELRARERQPVSIVGERWDPPALDRATKICEDNGFERVWFSSESGRAFTRDDAAISINQLGGYPIQIRIGADSPAGQKSLADAFLREPGLAAVQRGSS